MDRSGSIRSSESQVIEYNPEMEGVLEELLASKEKQDEFLFHNALPFNIVRPDNLLALEKWYGNEWAKEVRFVEEFEMAEYGRQMDEKEVMRLSPMIGKIGENDFESYFIGESRVIKSNQSGVYTWALMTIILPITKAHLEPG